MDLMIRKFMVTRSSQETEDNSNDVACSANCWVHVVSYSESIVQQENKPVVRTAGFIFCDNRAN